LVSRLVSEIAFRLARSIVVNGPNASFWFQDRAIAEVQPLYSPQKWYETETTFKTSRRHTRHRCHDPGLDNPHSYYTADTASKAAVRNTCYRPSDRTQSEFD